MCEPLRKWTVFDVSSAMAVVIVLNVCVFGASSVAAQTTNNSNATIEIASTRAQTLMLIPVKIGSSQTPRPFIIDSGASWTVIDSETAHELGLKRPKGLMFDVGASGGAASVGLLANQVIGVEGAMVRGVTAFAAELRQFEPSLGTAVDGILGHEFIRSFVVEIDYANSKVWLQDPNDFVYEGDGIVLPLEFTPGGLPVVEAIVQLGDETQLECQLMVDSGFNSDVEFTSKYSESHGLQTRLMSSQESAGRGLGGEGVVGVVGTVPGVSLGAWTVANPTVHLSRDKDGSLAGGSNYDGLLGGGVLSQCKVFFDYSRNRMILEPNQVGEVLNSVHLHHALKWHWGGRDAPNRYVVDRVKEDSRFFQAGLRAGDILVSVNGERPENLTLERLREISFDTGASIKLLVLQAGEHGKVVSIECDPAIEDK